MAATEQESALTASTLGSCAAVLEGGDSACGVELPRLIGRAADHELSYGRKVVRVISNEAVTSPACMDNSPVRLEVCLQPHSDSKLQITVPQPADPIMPPPSCGIASDEDHCSKSAPLANKQVQTLTASMAPATTTTCRRSLLHEFEKDLTFRPKLNNYSLKIVSRNARTSVPVVHRLLEVKGPLVREGTDSCSFAPKLNMLSIKLARERVTKMPEVQARMAQLTAARTAEAYAQYTFAPQVSQRSLQIAHALGTSFLARQQLHLERRQKVMDEVYSSPPRHLTRRQRPLRLIPRPPVASGHSGGSTESSTTSRHLTASGAELDHRSDAKPCKKGRKSMFPRSHSRARTPSLPLQSPSRQSLSGKEDETSPSRRIRRTFSVPNTASPERKKQSEKAKARYATSPPPAPHRAMDLSIKFVSLNEVDRFKRVKMVSENVIKAKKVFLIQGGYGTIRRCLRRRGWVELEYNKGALGPAKAPGKKKRKRHSSQDVGTDSDSSDDPDLADLGDQGSEDEYSDEEEYCMLSRAVRNTVPNFVWTLKREGVLYRTLHRDTIVNHFAKASSFTTKVGLCTNLHNLLWYGDRDPNTFYPRCYRLSCEEEKQAFIVDYRFTAALSLLKLVGDQLDNHSHRKPPSGNDAPRSSSGATSRPGSTHDDQCSSPSPSPEPVVVPEAAVRLALRACEAFLRSQEHEDIDGSQCQLCPQLSDAEWTTLVQHSYCASRRGAQIYCSYQLVKQAGTTLDQVEEHFPQLHMDGSQNIWIVKPGALSRGRGIMCMDRLEDILALVSSQIAGGIKENKWVIQKYIERPLLIHRTKFDIRQWFLVTDWNPLTMWMYKDCYLRFSTQNYTLDKMDQSVHLCNNSIQKHYENSSSRSDLLPEENMWDNDMFQDHLRSLGEGDKWDSVIYPGMKQALIHVLQVTQDEIEQRKNAFELYGADFMISEDFKPWLIEINCSPTMEASTAITTRMCRQVMEDTIKVVVDKRENRECDTGRFELVYKQPKLDVPSYVGIQLCVQGSAIPHPKSNSPRKVPTLVPTVKLGYTTSKT